MKTYDFVRGCHEIIGISSLIQLLTSSEVFNIVEDRDFSACGACHYGDYQESMHYPSPSTSNSFANTYLRCRINVWKGKETLQILIKSRLHMAMFSIHIRRAVEMYSICTQEKRVYFELLQLSHKQRQKMWNHEILNDSNHFNCKVFHEFQSR